MAPGRRHLHTFAKDRIMPRGGRQPFVALHRRARAERLDRFFLTGRTGRT
jgi:hypothetical protein